VRITNRRILAALVHEALHRFVSEHQDIGWNMLGRVGWSPINVVGCLLLRVVGIPSINSANVHGEQLAADIRQRKLMVGCAVNVDASELACLKRYETGDDAIHAFFRYDKRRHSNDSSYYCIPQTDI
jgi:hypothetical protein